MTVPIQSIYILDIVMISRYLFAFQNNKIDKKKLLIISIIQLIGFSVFSLSRDWLGTVLLFAIILLFQYYFENKGFPVNKVRVCTVVVYLVAAFLMGSKNTNLLFNPAVFAPLNDSPVYSIAGSVASAELLNSILLLVLGLSLATFEANNIIRLILETTNIRPSANSKSNYYAGRIIGVLERILIYTFVMQKELSAIAFILAAKSFARFKEMDNKDFAEYVLVGTLLSATLALAIALLVSKLKIA